MLHESCPSGPWLISDVGRIKMPSSRFGHFLNLQRRSWAALLKRRKPLTLSPISDSERVAWLTRHIPDRVRACLYGLPMRAPWRLPPVGISHLSPEVGCLLVGTHEGRMTALRWLILLIGLKGEKSWRPAVEELKLETDMRIDRLGGALFPVGRSEAQTLAKAWIGCSQATSHPTLGTNHPPVDPPALAEALAIVIEHLQRELYVPNKRDLFTDVMAPFHAPAVSQKV
jgi:hypothetical protein